MNTIVMVAAIAITASVDLKELDRLLDRNEEAVARLHSFRFDAQTRVSRDNGKTWKTTEELRVVRSGRREKLSVHSFGSMYFDVWREADSKFISILEPTGVRAVPDFDPAKAPTSPLSGADVDLYKGGIDRPAAESVAGWVNPWKIGALLIPESGSFRELIKRKIVESFQRGVDAEGHPTWILALRPRKSDDHAWETYVFSAFRDDLVVRSEIHFKNREKPWTSTTEVVDFWDVGAGLFFPKTVRNRPEIFPNTIMQTTFTNVQINRPIDESEFDVDFLEGSIVTDHRDQTVSLWGRGAPARKFASSDEFNAWNLERTRSLTPSMKRREFPAIPVVASALAVVVLVSLVIYRRGLTSA